MRLIPLTKDKFAMVDDEDYEKVSQHKWHVFMRKDKKSLYATYTLHDLKNHKDTTIRMHRFIMDASKNTQVDHIDGNGLNNQKNNLRFSTNQLNQANKGKNKNNKSGFKGVSFNNQHKRYISQVMFDGKVIYLGLYVDPIEAAKAHDKKAKELFGEFARTNF